MDVWVTLFVVPSEVPVPDDAVVTDAVVDGWACWLLPAEPFSVARMNSVGDTYVMFTVTAAGDGSGSFRSRRGLGWFGIAVEGSRVRVDLGADVLDRFIKALGPRGIRRADVKAVLADTFGSQLEAVHALLRSLRLARNTEFSAADYLAGHSVDSPDLPEVFRRDARGAPVQAIALDHGSAGWRHLCAIQDLYDFGEPPCLVRATPGGLFVASDPPVSLRFFDEGSDLATTVGGIGGWVEVPVSESGSVESFIAWARANVGTQGAPVSAQRSPLRREVPDQPQESYEAQFIGWPHQMAALPSLNLVLRADAGAPDPASMDAWLTTLRTVFIDAIANGYRERGGDAVHSDYGAWGEPNQMLVSITADAGRNRDMHPYDPFTDAGWKSARDALLKRGREIYISITVCNPVGHRGSPRWGNAEIHITPGTETTETTVKLGVSSLLLDVAGGADRIVELVSRAVALLGVTIGSASVGRTVKREGWLTALASDQLHRLGGIAALEATGVFYRTNEVEGSAGAMTLLQATSAIDTFDQAHADRVTAFLRK